MSEQLLLRRLRAGEPAALEALMDRYLPYVSAVVWNILRGALPPEDGEEVVSDVFLATWNQAPDKTYTQLFGGEFSFDIGLLCESRVIPLPCGPLTWTSASTGAFCTVEDLALSPLSLSYTYSGSTPVKGETVRPGVRMFGVVLKDGTEVPMRGGPGSEQAGCLFFDIPLDLSQVDHVRYMGHKVPVPLS